VSEKKIKVTDKRLFTAEGELKSEFRDLDDPESRAEDGARQTPEAPPEPAVMADPAAETASAREEVTPPADDGVESPGPGYAPPTFFDLVGVVAQPIALYLGDAKMPDGESLENLELARLYIDLLEVLHQKSSGNLSSEEESFLKDLLYQLKLRCVEKSG
jgi:hypothetical protein